MNIMEGLSPTMPCSPLSIGASWTNRNTPPKHAAARGATPAKPLQPLGCFGKKIVYSIEARGMSSCVAN